MPQGTNAEKIIYWAACLDITCGQAMVFAQYERYVSFLILASFEK